MSFHLFRRPGSAFVLDDDEAYLRMLGLVLPPHWHIRLFNQAPACLSYLRQEQEAWEDDCQHQEALVELWQQGRPLIPRLLAYWARQRSQRTSMARTTIATAGCAARWTGST